MIDLNIAANGTIILYECDPAKNTPPTTRMNRICNATAPRTQILH